MESPVNADANYREQAGRTYLEQRKSAASDHVQALRASLFADLTSPTVTMLDFGCGTGGILANLPAGQKIGVEIGSEAAGIARTRGLTVFSSLGEVESDSVDLAVSFHAIEHTENPATIMREIARVVRPGKRVRLIVPGENPRDPRQAKWRPNRDMHLYTWTPLIFGNLAMTVGFIDIATRIAPMPTRSRLVRLASPLPPLARVAHAHVANRLNSWNVILDAKAPG